MNPVEIIEIGRELGQELGERFPEMMPALKEFVMIWIRKLPKDVQDSYRERIRVAAPSIPEDALFNIFELGKSVQ